MTKAPRKITEEFKFKLALEAIKGERTIIQIASEYDIHPKQIQRWRNQLLEEGKDVFIHKTTQKKSDPDKAKLLHIIDQMKMELDFIKKKLGRND